MQIGSRVAICTWMIGKMKLSPRKCCGKKPNQRLTRTPLTPPRDAIVVRTKRCSYVALLVTDSRGAVARWKEDENGTLDTRALLTFVV